MQTAVNKETGERLVLVNGQWVPATQTAVNPETGQRMAQIGEANWVDITPQRGTGEELGRQIGLTGRHILGGLAKTGTGLADAGSMAINEAGRMMGMDPDIPMLTPGVDPTLTRMGLPEPEGATERVVGRGSEFMSGAALPVGMGRNTALALEPATQALAGMTGGLGTQMAAEADLPPAAQIGVGIASSLIPGAGRAAATSATRGLMRGTDPKTVQQNIDMYAKAGGSPTVGQASERGLPQFIEGGSRNVPGAAGPVNRNITAGNQAYAETAEELANRIAGRVTSEKAGRVIQSGIKGEGGFIDRFRSTVEKNYDRVDDFIDTAIPIEPRKTMEYFDAPSSMAANAPRTASALASDYMKRLGLSLSEDTEQYLMKYGDIGLPYAAMKEIRSAVGRKLDEVALVSDAPQAELKGLYGALSDDMRNAVESYGGPGGIKALNRAESYYKAGRSRIDDIAHVVNKSGGPEKVFESAISGTKEGATVFRQVMRSLKPDERDVVVGNLIRRMGKATPGQQNAAGDKFSINTYLTNWNRLSPEAKATMFGSTDKQVVEATNALAGVAENIANTSKMQNYSGTAQNIAALGALATATGSLAAGHVWPAVSLAVGVGGANLGSRLMTNKNFVTWLAKSTQAPKSAVPTLMNDLVQMAEETEDADLMELVGNLQ